MTPAEELTAAADKLDVLIAEATDGPWKVNERGSIWIADADDFGPIVDEGGHSIADASYIAAMNPLVGKALAESLRNDAAKIVKSTLLQPFYKGNPDLVTLARLINGGGS